jgi:hypothetical protein
MVYGAGSEQAFDVFLKTMDVADQAYWKYAMEPYADQVHAVDAAAQAMHEALGIPEAHASTVLRYGIPDTEWLLGLDDAQLEELKMTRDEAKQLAYFEWTDLVWDPHDPIDAAEVAMAATGYGLAAGGVVWALNRVRHLARLPGFVADALETRRFFKAIPALAKARKHEFIYDAAGNITDATRKFSISRHKTKTLANGRKVVTHVPEVKIKGLDTSIKPMHGGELRSVPAPIGPDESQISIPFMPEGFSELDDSSKPIAKYLYFDKTDFNQMADLVPELRDLANLSGPGDFEKAGRAAANFLGDFNAMTIPKAAGKAIIDNPKTSAAVALTAAGLGVAGEVYLSDQDAAVNRALSAAGGMPPTGSVPPEIAVLLDKGSSGEPGSAAAFFDPEAEDLEDTAHEADPKKTDEADPKKTDESVERKKEIIREEIIKYFSNRR